MTGLYRNLEANLECTYIWSSFYSICLIHPDLPPLLYLDPEEDWTNLDAIKERVIDNHGWFYKIEIADVNADGRDDIIASTWRYVRWNVKDIACKPRFYKIGFLLAYWFEQLALNCNLFPSVKYRLLFSTHPSKCLKTYPNKQWWYSVSIFTGSFEPVFGIL